MRKEVFNMGDIDIAWCPGCGNFSILNILKNALAEMEIPPQEVVITSGIGQAAKIPHYLKINVFNGLHGRALPPATAIKASNPQLTVIAESGDGDMYGEGGNHLIHTMRRNPDITNIVHNNMVYGLTKGQASPTSRIGFETPVQVNGVIVKPLNAVSLAISQNASFVARVYSGHREKTEDIIINAVKHHGYALIDLLHPCVSFNKLNTREWFEANTEYLEDSHDQENKEDALNKALNEGKLFLGIFYKNDESRTFEEKLDAYKNFKEPLFRRELDLKKLEELVDSRRR